MASTEGNNAFLGSIIEAAAGSDKPPRPIYRDSAIRNLERNLTSDINIGRSGLQNALSKYRTNLSRNNPLLRSAALESDAALSGALGRQTPMQDLFGVGDYLSGLFRKQVAPYIDPIARNIYNQTTISNLARGIGGTPAGSSYSDLLRGRILGQTAADYGSRMMGMLPSLFPQLQGANQNRFQELMGIFPQRLANFQALEGRAMMPQAARMAGLQDLQGLAMGQNALNLGNLQGYQPVKNWANKVGDVGRAITSNIDKYLSWAQQAASIYGSVMGGGMGGGGMGSLGSLFGGGGGGTPGVGAAQTGGGFQGTSPNQFSAIPSSGSYMGGYSQPYIGDINSGFQPVA